MVAVALEPEVVYDITVVAWNSAGPSAASAGLGLTTFAFLPPGSPTEVSLATDAARGTTDIVLAWSLEEPWRVVSVSYSITLREAGGSQGIVDVIGPVRVDVSSPSAIAAVPGLSSSNPDAVHGRDRDFRLLLDPRPTSETVARASIDARNSNPIPSGPGLSGEVSILAAAAPAEPVLGVLPASVRPYSAIVNVSIPSEESTALTSLAVEIRRAYEVDGVRNTPRVVDTFAAGIAAGSVREIEIDALHPRTDYVVSARAANSLSASTGSVQFATAALKPPRVPTDVVCATLGLRSIMITFLQYPPLLDMPPVDRYVVRIEDQGDGGTIEARFTNSAATAATDAAVPVVRQLKGLEPGRLYSVQVAAVSDATDLGRFSTACRAATVQNVLPDAPPVPVPTQDLEVMGKVTLTFDFLPEQLSPAKGMRFEVEITSTLELERTTFVSEFQSKNVVLTGLPADTEFHARARSIAPSPPGAPKRMSEWSRFFVVVTAPAGCDGVPFSDTKLDPCGVCGEERVMGVDGNCCLEAERDCEGVCRGGKTRDIDGKCCAPSVMDCRPRCEGRASLRPDVEDGGCCEEKERDECGVCGGQNDCTRLSVDGELRKNALAVSLVWGISGIERKRGTVEEPLANSAVILDRSFDLDAPGVLDHIAGTCRLARSDPALVQQAEGAMTCAPYSLVESDFYRIVLASVPDGDAPPPPSALLWAWVNLTPEGKSFSSLLSFDPDAAGAAAAAAGISQESRRRGRADLVVASSDGASVEVDAVPSEPVRVQWMAARFVTPASSSSPSLELVPFHDRWEDFVEERNEAAPSQGKVYQSSERWSLMYSEIAAINGVYYSIVISILFAFLSVLVFSANLHATVLGMMSMISIVGTVLGILFLLGRDLGAVEALSISVLVGSAVDASVHSLETYMEEPGVASRIVRAKFALGHIGPSIIHSVLTSIGSSSLLLLTEIRVLAQFGEIMCLNFAASSIFAIIPFTCLLAAIGPEISDHNGAMRKRIHYVLTLTFIAGIGVYVLYALATELGIAVPGPSGEPFFEPKERSVVAEQQEEEQPTE